MSRLFVNSTVATSSSCQNPQRMARCLFGWASAVKLLAVFGTALLAILAYQHSNGAYENDLYYGDSAAHFVTAVMIGDYLRTNIGSNPITFAEEYYLHCPKVAFGRWPPLFHFLQAGWYLAFGASKASALLLMGVITATLIAVVYCRLDRLYGANVAAAVVLLLASFASVRWQLQMVMSDVLTMLFCTLAAFALADFVGSRRTGDLLAIALWSALAIFTKENALHLAILVPCVLALAAGKTLWRDMQQRLVVAGVLVTGIGLAILRMQVNPQIHGYQGLTHLATRIVRFDDSEAVLEAFFSVASPLIFLIAGTGVVLYEKRRVRDERMWHERVCIAWLLSLVAFLLLVPAPPDSRYSMPALVPLMILTGLALFEIKNYLAGISHAMGLVAPWILCAVTIFSLDHHVPPRVGGFSAAAQAIPVRPNLVTLVSSDSFGEGAYIVERLMTDRSRAGITLRSGKMLASSDWHDEEYQLRMKTSDQVFRFLLEVPVHYIALDTYRPLGDPPSPHCTLLQRTLEEHPRDFIPVASLPRYHGDMKYEHAIVVYENVTAKDLKPQSIRVPVDRALGRVLQLNDTDDTAKHGGDRTSHAESP
jgi:hypothetical protein